MNILLFFFLGGLLLQGVKVLINLLWKKAERLHAGRQSFGNEISLRASLDKAA